MSDFFDACVIFMGVSDGRGTSTSSESKAHECILFLRARSPNAQLHWLELAVTAGLCVQHVMLVDELAVVALAAVRALMLGVQGALRPDGGVDLADLTLDHRLHDASCCGVHGGARLGVVVNPRDQFFGCTIRTACARPRRDDD